jgi:hypothetical protein
MPVRLLIQLKFLSSVWTNLFLNLAEMYKLGAKSLGATPYNHLVPQKGVLLPLPICIYVEVKKSYLSNFEELLSRPFFRIPPIPKAYKSEGSPKFRKVFYAKTSLFLG